MKHLSLPASSVNPSLCPLCPRFVKCWAVFCCCDLFCVPSHTLFLFFFLFLNQHVTSNILSIFVAYLRTFPALLIHTHTQRDIEYYIFITSDFDKVMSNSYLSEEVDRLACRWKLNLVWQGLVGALGARYKVMLPQKPWAHQLLSIYLVRFPPDHSRFILGTL